MSFKAYYDKYLVSSKLHVKNIMEHGPTAPFGYPEPLPEQAKRIDFIISHADGLVLDVGTDSGYLLQSCGGGLGVDISLLRLKVAKHFFPNLDLIQATAEYLPFRKEIFGTAICAELLEHVLNPEKVLNEVHAVLKSSGKLIVTVPDEIKGMRHMNPEHLRKFSQGELRNLLIRLFDIGTMEYIEGNYPTWCICGLKSEALWN